MCTREFDGIVVQYLGGSRDVPRDFMCYRCAAGLKVRALTLQRLIEAVGSQSGISLFALELVTLTGTDGLFAALRRQGATISVLA
jgi:hypothetical protein